MMARAGGNPDFNRIRNRDTTASIEKRRQNANEYAQQMVEALGEARNECGPMQPYGMYADWFNRNGYRTRRGNLWTARAVSRLFKRITSGIVGKAAGANR